MINPMFINVLDYKAPDDIRTCSIKYKIPNVAPCMITPSPVGNLPSVYDGCMVYKTLSTNVVELIRINNIKTPIVFFNTPVPKSVTNDEISSGSLSNNCSESDII